MSDARHPEIEPDSLRSWLRLAVCVAISAVGGVGMWSVVVALPAVQQEFGVARAGASLPYTLAMVGFAAGGVIMGRLADRFGAAFPVTFGTLSLCLGYVLSGLAPNLWTFALAHGVLIAMLGSAATFGPLMADISHWFVRRRGIAVAICASGNYLAGAVWPPVLQHFIATSGWRATQIGVGLFCLAAMLPLAYLLRGPAPRGRGGTVAAAPPRPAAAYGVSPGAFQALLIVAGVACCVAMAMPQVHIVAYCGDLGYGVARGAEMLSLMLGFGIVSRVASGFIADRIGGAATLLLGSVLQAVALLLYLAFDGLTSLYVISALFGLFQGGIVPMYALIAREYLPPEEAGAKVGVLITATIVGMAVGGVVSGWIFDYFLSYRVAFLNGLAWNAVNLAIVGWLLLKRRDAGLAAARA